MEERQLDRVRDLLDLVVEAADVVVGDVGHLLEHELLDLGPGQLLEQQARAGVHQHVVAGAELRAHEVVGELAHPLLVGPADDQRAVAVLEQLLEGDDLAGDARGARASTTLSDSLSTTSCAAARARRRRSRGAATTRILRPPVKTSTVPSSLRAEERAVGRRRLGELLDLLAQRGDVLARLAQGVGELLVLGDGLGELALGLEQPLLERAHPLGGVLQAAPQDDDLFFEDLGPARGGRSTSSLGLPVGVVVLGVDGDHLLVDLSATLPSRPAIRCPVDVPSHTVHARNGTFTRAGCSARIRRSAGLGARIPRCPGYPASHYSAPAATAAPHAPRTPPHEEVTRRMKVWIDQDLCTGDGLCEEIAPDVFTLLDDGLAYVKEGDKVFSDPGGAEGLANIPDGQLEASIESAEECPGECIFIEVE